MYYPCTKQQDESDCGAACISTIARFYGKRISVSRIRNIAGTDKDGTTAKGIEKAANYFGFSCKIIFSKTKELKTDLPFPIIAHTNKNDKNNTEHYVVIYKIKNGKLLIADPAIGLSWLKLTEFVKTWTGFFFFVSPTEKFNKVEDSKGVLSRFLYILSKNRNTIALIFLASFFLTLFGILNAFYFRYLIDEVIYSYLPTTLVTISLAYLLVIIFQSVLNYSRNIIVIHLSNKIESSLILKYLRHILRLPLDFFIKRKSGEILSRLTDISTIKNALSSMFVGILLDSVMLVFGGFILFKFSSALLSIAIFPVVLSGLLVFLFAKKFKSLIFNQTILEAEKYSHFVETINGIATIKALSTEKEAYDKGELKVLDTVKANITLAKFANLQNILQNFFSACGNLAIYWYGTYLIMNNQMSLGQLISFVTLLGYFTGPLGRLICLQPQLQEISVACTRFGQILDLQTEEELNKGEMNIERFNNEIQFKNINFSYGTRGLTLKDFNLSISKGEKIAFVGPSGSGKTTLVKLLLKFYMPTTGDIVIDNQNIKMLKTEYYRSFFGYVPQDILLFSGTIAENIAWGNEEASFEEIREAAIKAGALEFISKLENQFYTLVGEKGASLSGGEKQRIALARSLLKKPQILILVEATSNLDSLNEAQILQSINKLSKDTTVIIVAHRLSTIKNCDKIFVLSDGQVKENGTHKQLMQLKGIYKKMWNSQNVKSV